MAYLSFMAIIDSNNEVTLPSTHQNLKFDEEMSYDDMCNFYEEKLKTLNAKYGSLKKEILSLEKIMHDKDKELEDFRNSIEMLQETNESSNDDLKEENEKLKNDVNDLKNEILEMKKRFTNQFNVNWRKPLDKSGIGLVIKIMKKLCLTKPHMKKVHVATHPKMHLLINLVVILMYLEIKV